MKTIKKRLLKSYRALGNFSLKYIQPLLLGMIGFALTYWLGSRIYRFALAKTASVGWSWAVSILAILILGALGAANDAEKAQASARKAAKKSKKGSSPKMPAAAKAQQPRVPGSGIQPPSVTQR